MICRCVLPFFLLCIFRNYDTACFLAVLLLACNFCHFRKLLSEIKPQNDNYPAVLRFAIWTRFLRKYAYSRVSDLTLTPVTGMTKSWAGPRTRLTYTYKHLKVYVWEKSYVATRAHDANFFINKTLSFWWYNCIAPETFGFSLQLSISIYWMFIKVVPFMLAWMFWMRSTGSHRATFPEMIAKDQAPERHNWGF